MPAMPSAIATAALFGSSPTLPAAASSDTLHALTGLFVLFVGAKLGEEVARRLGQPGVLGELAGGFIVGPHALGFVTPDAAAMLLAELGVIVLLFSVGLEVQTDQLLAVGRPAVATAVVGMVLPIAVASGLMLAIGTDAAPSAFVGLALAATSIGITSRVLADMGLLQRSFARVILGAAIVDDILVLVLIGIMAGVVEGDLSASTLLVVVAAVGLLLLGCAAARRARGLPREVFTWWLFADTPLAPAFILMLLGALVAASIGLAAIIGAFVVGLIIAETEARHELEVEVRSLATIFAPFFFAVTGAQLDLGALLAPELLGLALALGAVGIATKVAGGLAGAAPIGRAGALAVGIGMVPRGEVGIVVANLGLASGLVSDELFSVILVAVVLTTVAAPLLLAPTARAAARAETGT